MVCYSQTKRATSVLVGGGEHDESKQWTSQDRHKEVGQHTQKNYHSLPRSFLGMHVIHEACDRVLNISIRELISLQLRLFHAWASN